MRAKFILLLSKLKRARTYLHSNPGSWKFIKNVYDENGDYGIEDLRVENSKLYKYFTRFRTWLAYADIGIDIHFCYTLTVA